MKKYSISAIVIFVISYLVFVLVNVPATWVLEQLKLPPQLKLAGVQGNIWHFSLAQVSWQQWQVTNVDVRLNKLSLLMLNPKAQIQFDGAVNTDAQGKADVSLAQGLSITNAKITVSANDIAAQLPLPVEALAAGQGILTIEQFTLGKPVCSQLQGQLRWTSAAVETMGQNVDLGNLNAKLSCQQGAVAMTTDKNNNLGLAVTAYYRGGQQFSVNGYLTPGNKFPKPLKQVLPFLGKADHQGRYRISF